MIHTCHQNKKSKKKYERMNIMIGVMFTQQKLTKMERITTTMIRSSSIPKGDIDFTNDGCIKS